MPLSALPFVKHQVVLRKYFLTTSDTLGVETQKPGPEQRGNALEEYNTLAGQMGPFSLFFGAKLVGP
jgi:hypothetical protein